MTTREYNHRLWRKLGSAVALLVLALALSSVRAVSAEVPLLTCDGMIDCTTTCEAVGYCYAEYEEGPPPEALCDSLVGCWWSGPGETCSLGGETKAVCYCNGCGG